MAPAWLCVHNAIILTILTEKFSPQGVERGGWIPNSALDCGELKSPENGVKGLPMREPVSPSLASCEVLVPRL